MRRVKAKQLVVAALCALVLTPAALAQGLLEALLGPSAVVRIFGVAVFGFFLWFVGRGLSVAYPRAEGVK